MCSRSQCHRLWWMARRRFSHETQMANCLPSGLVKTKGKNSSIFFGRLSIVCFVLWLTSLINCYTFLMCGLKIGSKNLHSKWSWVCAVHPGGTEMGFFYLLFPQKICWSVPRIDGDKMIWLKMKRKEKRCWGQIKFHTKSIKPKHKFVNSDLILTYAKLGLINRKQKQIRP